MNKAPCIECPFRVENMLKVGISFYEKAKELSPKCFYRAFHRCHMTKDLRDCAGFIKEAYDRQDNEIISLYEADFNKK